jgi:hypothetical protein
LFHDFLHATPRARLHPLHPTCRLKEAVPPYQDAEFAFGRWRRLPGFHSILFRVGNHHLLTGHYGNVPNGMLGRRGRVVGLCFLARCCRSRAQVVQCGRGDFVHHAREESSVPSVTPSTQPQAVVATYDSHATAEGAIKSLQQSGFDMKRLSILSWDPPSGGGHATPRPCR